MLREGDNIRALETSCWLLTRCKSIVSFLFEAWDLKLELKWSLIHMTPCIQVEESLWNKLFLAGPLAFYKLIKYNLRSNTYDSY